MFFSCFLSSLRFMLLLLCHIVSPLIVFIYLFIYLFIPLFRDTVSFLLSTELNISSILLCIKRKDHPITDHQGPRGRVEV
jgi:hypothetical protein